MLDDLDLLEAVLAPLVADPLGEHAIARRAGDVGLGGEVSVRLTGAAPRRQRQESPLERSLGGRSGR